MSAWTLEGADLGPPPICCTFGIQTQTEWPDRRTLSWRDLAGTLTTHAVGRKEGSCIVPAVFRGKHRHKADAEQIDAAFLDSDSGATLEEIATAVRRAGWAAIISSTHSHLTTITKAKRSNWQKFFDDCPIGAETAFLVETKGMLPHIAAAAVVDRETEEFVFFRHQPCSKYRIVIPLLRPWRAAEHASQDAANIVWKERIEALAAALGLQHDQACTDTSRLFYLPRRPDGGPPPESTVIDGDPCDIFSLPGPEIPLSKAASRQQRNAGSLDDYEHVDPATGQVTDLRDWAREHGDKFLIAKALQKRKPAYLTGRVVDQVKVHIRCPNEDKHTEPGVDGATFITDAGLATNKGFVIHCRHAHCDGKDRLFFVKRMLDQKWLAIEDLTNPEFLRGAEETDGEGKPNGQAGSDDPCGDSAEGEDEASAGNGAENESDEVERQRILKQRKDAAATKVAATIVEFNARYIVVNEAGRAIVYAPKKDPILNRSFYERITFEDLRRLYLNRSLVADYSKKGEPLVRRAADVWLYHPDRRQFVGGVTFDPSGRLDALDTLNLWQGFAVQPKPGNWTLMREHVRVIICRENPEHFHYLMGWMARLVQYPAKQGEVAVVMRGGEGTGKGTLARALKRILGQHGLAISNAKHLTGSFNAHLRDCVFLFADECFYAGDRSHVGVLKSIITEPYLTVEGKYQNAVQTPNFLHLMMASNEEWVVPASLDARRFFFLEVGDEAKNNQEYFDAIWQQMESGGYEAMLHDLLHYDLTGFNVRHVFVTDALEHQKKLTLSTTESWWLDVLLRGYVYKSKLGLESHFSQWHEFATTELLFTSYTEFAERHHERHPLSRETLGRFLIKMGGKAKRPKHGVVGEHMIDEPAGSSFGTTRRTAVLERARPCGYHLGTLEAARDSFTTTTHLTMDWHDNDPEL